MCLPVVLIMYTLKKSMCIIVFDLTVNFKAKDSIFFFFLFFFFNFQRRKLEIILKLLFPCLMNKFWMTYIHVNKLSVMHMCGIYICTDIYAYTAIHMYIPSCAVSITLMHTCKHILKRIMKCLQFKLRVFQGWEISEHESYSSSRLKQKLKALD